MGAVAKGDRAENKAPFDKQGFQGGSRVSMHQGLIVALRHLFKSWQMRGKTGSYSAGSTSRYLATLRVHDTSRGQGARGRSWDKKLTKLIPWKPADLAELYEVETKFVNLAVRRNAERFPTDFMFQLTAPEHASLRLQFATSNEGRGGRRYRPYAFTEQGVAILSSVLRSPRAVQVNIAIMRAP